MSPIVQLSSGELHDAVRMNIEVGKFYRTRGGHKVRIYAIDGIKLEEIHGAIKVKGTDSWQIAYWNSLGECRTVRSDDIVAEWPLEPIFYSSPIIENKVVPPHQMRLFASENFLVRVENRGPVNIKIGAIFNEDEG